VLLKKQIKTFCFLLKKFSSCYVVHVLIQIKIIVLNPYTSKPLKFEALNSEIF